MGATSVPTDAPQPGKPQPPIWPLAVGDHGAWLETRATPADGACGVHGYPCQHPGVDVAGIQGTAVVAPETGTVVAIGDGSIAPFVGYGPWFAIIQGAESGKYHLLAHLEPMTSSMAPAGVAVIAGDQIGTTSSANHTHWEVRDKMMPDFAAGETNFDNNSDPLAWLTLARIGALGAVLLVGAAAALWWLIIKRHRR